LKFQPPNKQACLDGFQFNSLYNYFVLGRVNAMEWFNKMNSAIDYIEAKITEKVDYAQAAQIACCSLSRFQNMFQFLTDITPLLCY